MRGKTHILYTIAKAHMRLPLCLSVWRGRGGVGWPVNFLNHHIRFWIITYTLNHYIIFWIITYQAVYESPRYTPYDDLNMNIWITECSNHIYRALVEHANLYTPHTLNAISRIWIWIWIFKFTSIASRRRLLADHLSSSIAFLLSIYLICLYIYICVCV
jgi:hypothetical protein